MTTCKRPKCGRKAEEKTGLCRDHSQLVGYRRPLVDATKAVEHVRWCLDRGASIHGIADGTGLDRMTIREHLNGKHDRMRRGTFQAMMRATPEMAGVVSSRGAVRRVRALRAAGWRVKELLPLIGMSETGMRRLCAGEWDTILSGTDARIRRVYAAAGEKVVRPPSRQVAAKKWPLPADWDDIDTDPEPGWDQAFVPITPRLRAIAMRAHWSPKWDKPYSSIHRILEGTSSKVARETAEALWEFDRNIKTSTRKKAA